MWEITQTRTGKDGNCFAACISSIFEIPLEEIPEFGDASFLDDVDTFLEPRGLYYVQVPLDDESLSVVFRKGHILSTIEGLSPRGGLHACVALNGKLIWDPHPQDGTGRGLVREDCYGLFGARPRLFMSARKVIQAQSADILTSIRGKRRLKVAK
jgi:hypothetical protein